MGCPTYMGRVEVDACGCVHPNYKKHLKKYQGRRIIQLAHRGIIIIIDHDFTSQLFCFTQRRALLVLHDRGSLDEGEHDKTNYLRNT
jgi:hypothetical protein